MPESSHHQSDLERVIEILSRHGVEFIVIGGQAEVLHGGGRVTFDTDFCYRRTAENLKRLAAALLELKPTLRGAPADLPFRIDAQALALGCNFTFDTTCGDVDFLGEVQPLGVYEDVLKNAVRYEIGSVQADVISLDDLIKVKKFIRRPKDRDSLLQLKAIKESRGEPWID